MLRVDLYTADLALVKHGLYINASVDMSPLPLYRQALVRDLSFPLEDLENSSFMYMSGGTWTCYDFGYTNPTDETADWRRLKVIDVSDIVGPFTAE